ncbi:MAG: sensor histidine kinase [Cyclonatronaceae bacterium]
MKFKMSLRVVLFGLGLLAVVGLTGMNVYSLYALHESTINTSVDNQKNQISEFTFQTRSRFRTSLRGMRALDMAELQHLINNGRDIPDSLLVIIRRIDEDPLFSGSYFLGKDIDPCQANEPLLRYNSKSGRMEMAGHYPEQVCDGINLARARMKSLVGEYQWNNRLIHDAERSMTVAMINPEDHSIAGYLTILVNEDYLINEFLAPGLVKFGNTRESGMTLWLHDWTVNEVLATNDSDVIYDIKKVEQIQRFPEMLENWNIKIAFHENPIVAASNKSLMRNLIILGVGVLLLLGSLVFIYTTAQREQNLARRQAGFLANVTHELKTPLAVMQAAGENLADGRVTSPERLSSYGKHIFNESVRLRKMIEKLLDVAKNEAGQTILKKAPNRVDELVKNFLRENETWIHEKGFKIALKRDKNIPLVMLDADSFFSIMGNLVENAIKYSTNDKYLGIEVIKDEKFVSVHVRDHGIGIPKSAQKYVFDKFYRVENEYTSNTKGHGLGLSIVKNLVELNGGIVTLKSQEGTGSVFTISFPVIVKPESASPSKNILKVAPRAEYVS